MRYATAIRPGKYAGGKRHATPSGPGKCDCRQVPAVKRMPGSAGAYASAIHAGLSSSALPHSPSWALFCDAVIRGEKGSVACLECNTRLRYDLEVCGKEDVRIGWKLRFCHLRLEPADEG